MYDYKMKLTKPQLEILSGKEGEIKAKVMETLVRFGDIFEAKKLVKVTHECGHLVTSFGIGILKPVFSTMDKIIEAGLTVDGKFTVDPRPLDYENVPCNMIEKLVFNKFIYGKQDLYEKQLEKIGLKNTDAFTCTCYLDEVGNTPKKGDVLSWAESSAVVFANSVLGARCNRNSGMLDIFGSLVGYVPYFGFLTDEGRKATWKVTIKTTQKPEAQILGSAIGMKVVGDVPYVYGLDSYIDPDIKNPDTISYLKDFGAATASNGSVGLYHIDKITPEAKELSDKLLSENVKEYVIDDAEMERVYKSYPIMWKNKNAKPHICFIGCPHLTLKQLEDWTLSIEKGLKANNREKVYCHTVMTTAPDVLEVFKKTEFYNRALATGVKFSSICPLMYAESPLSQKHAIMTNSNKLRTYSCARYYKDQEILDILTGGRK